MKKYKLISVLIASLTLTFTLSLSASALHGDVNYDEYIGIEDAITALRFATGIETPDEHQEHSADLNYDGEITTEDVRLIMRGAADIDYVPDHFFSDWETITPPTCTEEGVCESVCYYCNKKVTKTIKSSGHTVVPATCESASYCSACNEVLGEALEHSEKEGYCENCGTLIYTPTATYNGKKLKFGCSSSNVKSTLGEPQFKGKDTSAENTVVVYAYYTDYTDLAIFTFVDGALTQYFSNSSAAKVNQGTTHYSLDCEIAPEAIGDIQIATYSDSLNNNRIYAFCATVGEAYNLTKTTEYTLLEKINLHLTNGLRAMNGVAPLKYCADASAVAEKHSKDMATRNFFDHENPDGNRIGYRLTEGGVDWVACAENIAAGIYDPYALANGWYNSDSHRSSMLNEKYKYLGIGFAYSEKANYKYYSTQNFYTDQ